jgi:ATP-dependent RNA helicase DeaD
MELLKYEESNVDSRIQRAVKEMGFENMTPIQSEAIPALMEGKDIIGQAQTGTGKTAAFGIPLIQSIDSEIRDVQGMILCPTRELAIQAANEIRRFSKFMQSIKVVPVYGGQDILGQIRLIKGGAQIVVGTPGRVMDHLRRKTLKLDNLKMIILDEADEMLNMGFKEDMETILKEIPHEHQTALFSATMPKAILDITKNFQKEDAVHIKIAAKELTIPLVEQFYFEIKGKYKDEATHRLIQSYGIKRSIIFCNTKKMVDELAANLKEKGYQVDGLHGDLSQRQRDFVMKRFRGGITEILIATDVAARGIDVDNLEAVFNYDVPQDIEYYVHRIGRTGRAGKKGLAFTFAYGRDMFKIRDIEKICKTKMTEGTIPSATKVVSLKADKILTEATTVLKTKELGKIKDILKKATESGETTIEDLAAALLKMQLGEETVEIEMEEKRKEYSRKSDNFRRESSRRDGARGDGFRRDGGRGGDNFRRDGGKRDGARRDSGSRYKNQTADSDIKKVKDVNLDGSKKENKAYKPFRKFGKK